MVPKKRLVGMRFHPTDDELVNHYLRRKQLKVAEDREACVIPVMDIYDHEPPKLNKVYDEISDEKSDGSYCYFFCPRDSTKTRYTKRKTIDGFWKETSEKQVVQDEATEEVMWTKRYFVYHQGPQRSSSKTDWVMHEYCLASRPEADTTPNEDAFALCHIKRKKKKNKQVKQRKTHTPAKSCSRNGAGQGSSLLPQTVADQQLGIPGVNEENISTQVSIESDILTNSEPSKHSVNDDKPSQEQQSENNIMTNNNYDPMSEDYISIADLFNQEELDQEFWAALKHV